MISAMLKSTIILIAAAGVAGLLRRQSSAVRHTIWAAGLVGALAVPLCSALLPVWQPGIVARTAVLFQSSAPAARATEVPLERGDATARSTAEAAAWPSLAQTAFAVWIAGAAIGMVLLFGGTAKLAWVAIRAERMDDGRWTAAVSKVARELRLKRPIRLLQNRTALFLGTWGIVSPRVLLPSDAEYWPDDRVRMVPVHELAHIKRHDWCLQVLAEAARAIYWFNPLFWLAHSRLRRESEHACDDAVLRLGAAGPQYAEELLDLARTLRRSRTPVLAMAQPSHLERRLVALLNPSLKRLAATPWATVVVALIAIGLTLPIAAVRVMPEHQAPTPQTSEAIAYPVAEAQVQLAGPLAAAPRTAALSARTKTKSQPRHEAPAATTEERTATTESSASVCAVTPSVRETPLILEKTAPLGPGPWHINADRTIWVWDQPYVARRPMKTMWIRPAGAELSITGRRIDGPAPPLEANVPCCYLTGYQASGLVFPTPGCWEVTAVAGNSTLVFVTRVSEEEQ